MNHDSTGLSVRRAANTSDLQAVLDYMEANPLDVVALRARIDATTARMGIALTVPNFPRPRVAGDLAERSAEVSA